MSIEQKLNAKYESHGVMSSDYLYLPLEWAMKYVQECSTLRVAVIDVEFFQIFPDGRKKTSYPLYGIDSSRLLKKVNNWNVLVEECNTMATTAISEQMVQDATQYCLITILEQEKWLKWYPEKA